MTQVIKIDMKFSNAFLILGDRPILVDTGGPKKTKAILRAMADNHIRELALIVHTHAHMDHCGSSVDLHREFGAPLAIHREDALYFEKGENAPIFPANLPAKCLMPFMNSGFAGAMPDIVFDDEFDLKPFGTAGKIIATPGHTPGSVSVLLESGDVIAGDMMGGGRLLGLLEPERPRHHYWHWDFDINSGSLEKVMALKPARIHVGHGGPLDGKAAAAYFEHQL